MKIAEALILRADIQKRISQLKTRLDFPAKWFNNKNKQNKYSFKNWGDFISWTNCKKRHSFTKSRDSAWIYRNCKPKDRSLFLNRNKGF